MIALLAISLLTSGSKEVPWTNGFSFQHSQWLPAGLVLLTESGYYSEGNRDRIRLTWFRPDGSRFRKVQSYEGITTLDHLQPIVVGNEVWLTTVDDPHAFQPCAADDTFARETKWTVKNGKLRLVRSSLLQPRLRAVAAAIWHSWSAKNPSPLQRQLRKAWPEPDSFGPWSEKRQGARWTVTVDQDCVFTLSQTSSGKWKVVAFAHPRKRAIG